MKFGARLIQILAVSIVASSLLTTFTSSLVLAQGEGTTVGTFELTATFECISVYANFGGDDNGNNQATLEYREGGGSWKQGMTLTVDRRQTIYDRLYYNFGVGSNPFANQWRGSVLGLRPNTQYEVRVTFTDPDGVIGTNPISGNIRTRNDNFPQGKGNTYYVATSGNDSNPGTETLPWRTIQKAANIVSTGDTVYIKAGTYVESITLTRSAAALLPDISSSLASVNAKLLD
jgi:hypothetical protein